MYNQNTKKYFVCYIKEHSVQFFICIRYMLLAILIVIKNTLPLPKKNQLKSFLCTINTTNLIRKGNISCQERKNIIQPCLCLIFNLVIYVGS